MPIKNNVLNEEKLKKLQAIRDLGINPYPHSFKRTAVAKELHAQFDGLEAGAKQETVIHKIAGRLMAIRDMGKSVFLDLKEDSGSLQVYVNTKELTGDSLALVSLLDIGDIIGVEGYIFKTKMGELSLHCQTLTMLCKSIEVLPDKYHGLKDLELKYRYRHLDLIMDDRSKEVFRTRAKILQEIRNFMDSRGFLEMNTPVLQPIYGGASAYPFSTHMRSLDLKLFLRISDELYLKRLIVGGFEKVYEIAQDFRNEGIDHTHNPEFCMMEWYEAYTDYHDQMRQFEELTMYLAQKVCGTTKITYQGQEVDLQAPWRRLTVYDGLRQYAGIEPETIGEEALRAAIRKFEPEYAGRPSKGEMLMDLFEYTVEEHLIQPTFVMDHPVEVSPLTKAHRTQPGLVERFEPFICKMEVGNSYTELNDPEDQFARLAEQEKNRIIDEEAQPMDEEFVKAIRTGMPPTGGVGYGIERIVMLLTDSVSIRDVLPFPLMRPLEKKNEAELSSFDSAATATESHDV